MQHIIPVVTVDGPSGVGKGTLSEALADYFNWHLLDSGAIYRVLAFQALKRRISLHNEIALSNLALVLPLTFVRSLTGTKIMLANDDVTGLIRTEAVGDAASEIATLARVRQALLQRQRNFCQSPGLIADGRDMGSVVFPDAIAKIFLDASLQSRATRRRDQLQQKGIYVKIGAVLRRMSERDERDRNRPVAPLKPAADALVIDSTLLSVSDVFERSVAYIKQKLAC